MKPLESIRQDIEDIRELILSLDDEVWSRIDHRDNEALAEFTARKTRINDRIKSSLLHAKIDTGRMKIILRGNPDLAGTMFE